MRIYLVRHGETTLNQKGCYYGRTDVPLTQEGREQAERLRDFFSGHTFDKVIVSPLKRTVETAEIIMAGYTNNLIFDDRLLEQDFGIFEGYSYDELIKKYPLEVEEWNRDFSNYHIPGGESFAEVRKRTESFFNDFPRGNGSILIVAHKGTLGHFLAASLGLPLEGYWNFVFDQGCYNLIDLEDGYAIVRKLNQSV